MADGSEIETGTQPGTGGDGPGSLPPGSTGGPRKDRARLYAGASIGALLTAFALLNLDDVKVHWIIGTAHTPLIIVVAIAFLCGVALDRLILRVKRRRAKLD
jgi:hypothetical protein